MLFLLLMTGGVYPLHDHGAGAVVVFHGRLMARCSPDNVIRGSRLSDNRLPPRAIFMADLRHRRYAL